MYARCALVFICVAILVNCQTAMARTRYEEFDYKGCLGAASRNSESPKAKLNDRKVSCALFCGMKGYAAGGCDCQTQKCVCADMNLDFCNFQEIKYYI